MNTQPDQNIQLNRCCGMPFSIIQREKKKNCDELAISQTIFVELGVFPKKKKKSHIMQIISRFACNYLLLLFNRE